MIKILNAEPDRYSFRAKEILKSFAVVDETPCSREELIDRIEGYDVLIVRLGHKVDEPVLCKAHRLKYIVTATTGLNHIDLEAAKEHGIRVLSLRGEGEFLRSVSATAEHSWGLMLALMRKMVPSTLDVCSGHWNRDAFKGNELQGKTIGIIGFGRLGSKIARYAQAFEMKVLACDIHTVSADGVEPVSLDELLERADIVSVHVSYDTSTHHLLHGGNLSKMKCSAFLVNTARGEVLDESALLVALREGRIAGAALDVLCGENTGNPEWMAQDPLMAYARENQNLLITPHIGGATHESMEKTEIFMAEKLRRTVAA